MYSWRGADRTPVGTPRRPRRAAALRRPSASPQGPHAPTRRSVVTPLQRSAARPCGLALHHPSTIGTGNRALVTIWHRRVEERVDHREEACVNGRSGGSSPQEFSRRTRRRRMDGSRRAKSRAGFASILANVVSVDQRLTVLTPGGGGCAHRSTTRQPNSGPHPGRSSAVVHRAQRSWRVRPLRHAAASQRVSSEETDRSGTSLRRCPRRFRVAP